MISSTDLLARAVDVGFAALVRARRTRVMLHSSDPALDARLSANGACLLVTVSDVFDDDNDAKA
jgi:hypothetical protein